MKIKTKLSAVTQDDIKMLGEALERTGGPAETFKELTDPYESFTRMQLDAVFLVADVTIEGSDTIKELKPSLCLDQEGWTMFEDEEDMAIDQVFIPLELLYPVAPISIDGSTSFQAVFKSNENLFDACKELPDFVWNSKKFEFMLSVDAVLENGDAVTGDYQSVLIDLS